jgi:hypothetical protein
MAFVFAYSLTGTAPIIERIVVKNAAVLSKGEMCNLESGELDAGAAADTALVGAALEDVDNTADGLYCSVIVNEDAVYSVVDANARTKGDLLDLASGGLLVTSASSNTFIVVETSTASEPTLVTFNATHYLD